MVKIGFRDGSGTVGNTGKPVKTKKDNIRAKRINRLSQ